MRTLTSLFGNKKNALLAQQRADQHLRGVFKNSLTAIWGEGFFDAHIREVYVKHNLLCVALTSKASEAEFFMHKELVLADIQKEHAHIANIRTV